MPSFFFLYFQSYVTIFFFFLHLCYSPVTPQVFDFFAENVHVTHVTSYFKLIRYTLTL